jgi:hypothetical protein
MVVDKVLPALLSRKDDPPAEYACVAVRTCQVLLDERSGFRARLAEAGGRHLDTGMTAGYGASATDAAVGRWGRPGRAGQVCSGVRHHAVSSPQ